ncbi:transcriptional regulator, TetR family [Clostridium cavendishii DSM 21758]|uniref:Transcriptional regulator, TetR family n=1 Tax=Clostridium cavendishii DSM 21758 TaxID=1121302 RepID=A0A1M6QZE9_9CLOT|nr:TetR/AcrR family transcriptional regulator [Clostridium cavendishii]SHK25602.1 transcriptional regulator, TetR family [Clostridium cavendishii DSM 21758]
MPKIIKDIENTIKQCSIKLFIDFGYNAVDMRMISKNSKIAVGTIYNYYENKKELYLNILEESWQSTFDKLDKISTLTLSKREKSELFIEALYEDIEERNGLGKALIAPSSDELMKDERAIKLKNNLLLRVESFLNSLNTVDESNKYLNNKTRLAECLLTSILTMFEFHADEKAYNIKFLVEFINLSIK